MRKALLFGAVTAVALASAAIAAPAQAGGRHGDAPGLVFSPPTTLTSGLTTPLSLDIDARGNAVLSQNFIGQLTRISSSGTRIALAVTPAGLEAGAVSSRRDTVYYAQNDQPNGVALLMALRNGSAPRQLADLHAYEASRNPDQVNRYGFRGLPASCSAQIDPAGPAGPASYRGIVDSHPYASLALRDGVYVADAGGNDIVRVGYDGRVSTVAVLPAQPPVTVTAALAEEAGLPACSVGYPYSFEPVPTDVERGPDGALYVSTLPGGPEDASLGARGSVYRISPWNGAVQLVASGFVGATDLAVDQQSGTVLVAELFGGPTGTGQISVLSPWTGRVSQRIAVTSPGAIELRNGVLYGTTSAFVPDANGAPQAIGQLVRWNVTDRAHHQRWGDDGERDQQ
jgi:hypothetical protein